MRVSSTTALLEQPYSRVRPPSEGKPPGRNQRKVQLPGSLTAQPSVLPSCNLVSLVVERLNELAPESVHFEVVVHWPGSLCDPIPSSWKFSRTSITPLLRKWERRCGAPHFPPTSKSGGTIPARFLM